MFCFNRNNKLADAAKGHGEAEAEIAAIESQINEYIELIPETKIEIIRMRYTAKIQDLDQRAKDLKNKQNNKKEPHFEEALELVLKFLGTPGET